MHNKDFQQSKSHYMSPLASVIHVSIFLLLIHCVERCHDQNNEKKLFGSKQTKKSSRMRGLQVMKWLSRVDDCLKEDTVRERREKGHLLVLISPFRTVFILSLTKCQNSPVPCSLTTGAGQASGDLPAQLLQAERRRRGRIRRGVPSPSASQAQNTLCH